MVLISIHPFLLRRLLLVLLALLGFSALCFADPVLMVRRYAPATERPEAGLASPGSEPSTMEAQARTDFYDPAAGLATGPLSVKYSFLGNHNCEWRSRHWPMSVADVLASPTI